jgi:hypothetical protein
MGDVVSNAYANVCIQPSYHNQFTNRVLVTSVTVAAFISWICLDEVFVCACTDWPLNLQRDSKGILPGFPQVILAPLLSILIEKDSLLHDLIF